MWMTVRLQVLLLDEITVDLDVLGRADLFKFLREECEDRNVTIIYVRDCIGHTLITHACSI